MAHSSARQHQPALPEPDPDTKRSDRYSKEDKRDRSGADSDPASSATDCDPKPASSSVDRIFASSAADCNPEPPSSSAEIHRSFLGDHPSITPMRSATEDMLGHDAWRLYQYICQYFIGTVSPDCKFTSKADINIQVWLELEWRELEGLLCGSKSIGGIYG